VNPTALTIKPARKHKMHTGYSKHGLRINISYRKSGIFKSQRTVMWWSHSLMVGSPEIWDEQFRENNKTCSAGQNGVWGGIGSYLKQDEVTEGQKLEDTVLSLLDRSLGQNHHICQAMFETVW